VLLCVTLCNYKFDFLQIFMSRYLMIFSLFVSSVAFSQESNLIVEIAEELAADDSDPEAVSLFIDRLHELSENRVRINNPDQEEISRLFFLSDFQVKAIKEYVDSSGQIVSIYELANIPGFDKETAEMIMPFIIFEKRSFLQEDFQEVAQLKRIPVKNF